jgi:3-oxocholest-4-en-26-oate---CoA ligase
MPRTASAARSIASCSGTSAGSRRCCIATINSGGEKIFAEEVEAAVTSHPSIADVVVTGRPSERWGQEVVAVVQVVDSAILDEAALTKHAEKSLARYKLPKAWIQVPEVRRSPVGKADYRWANSVAVQEVTS